MPLSAGDSESLLSILAVTLMLPPELLLTCSFCLPAAARALTGRAAARFPLEYFLGLWIPDLTALYQQTDSAPVWPGLRVTRVTHRVAVERRCELAEAHSTGSERRHRPDGCTTEEMGHRVAAGQQTQMINSDSHETAGVNHSLSLASKRF